MNFLRVQKLGKNQGRYNGETIEISSVLEQITAAAKATGWQGELIGHSSELPVMAWHRAATGKGEASHRLYISAGIHGDEPAGPLAALRLLQENAWPGSVEIYLLPCLNPVGFRLNRREDASGRDLNRDYRNPQSSECRAHIAWLERQPGFDGYFCLHEDWESSGFYLYEQNPLNRPSLAGSIIEAVKKVCPIDDSEIIEGRKASGGIIRPLIQVQDRPDWPEAFYLITHKATQGYTLEAPSDFPLTTRISALVAGTSAAISLLTLKSDGKPS